jgi:uncharacterized coiled-coil protein SlyX
MIEKLFATVKRVFLPFIYVGGAVVGVISILANSRDVSQILGLTIVQWGYFAAALFLIGGAASLVMMQWQIDEQDQRINALSDQLTTQHGLLDAQQVQLESQRIESEEQRALVEQLPSKLKLPTVPERRSPDHSKVIAQLRVYQRAFEALAAKIDVPDPRPEYKAVEERFNELRSAAGRYLGENLSFLGNSAGVRFLKQHHSLPLSKPGMFNTAMFDKWVKIMSCAKHLEDYAISLGATSEEDRSAAL